MQVNKKTLSLLFNTIRNNEWVDLPSSGTSMYPLIKDGNVCRFIHFNPLKSKKGDILLYHTESGQLIAHRFIQKKMIDGKAHFVLKGDTNLTKDEPIGQEQIIGKLITIQREKKKIYLNKFSCILMSCVITFLPIISILLRAYLAYNLKMKTKTGTSI